MKFASVIIDIPARAIRGHFDYFIPEALIESCQVGSAVLLPFGNRPCIGYVSELKDETVVPVNKLKAIQKVLSSSYFDAISAQLMLWISREYASNVADALKLFLPPGQNLKLKVNADGSRSLEEKSASPLDERWVELTPLAESFVPRANASLQKMVLAALSGGAQKVVELEATLPGSNSCIKRLADKGVVEIFTKRKFRVADQMTTTLSSAKSAKPEHFTEGQLAALETISKAVAAKTGEAVLLEGVTGSGKTEVYLSAIEEVVKAGRGAIVLVPEISLTAQTLGRFRSRFGDKVALIHSKLSVGERLDQWDLIQKGEISVVVGARSALFAPLKNLGLIIIDEEHEQSYKQDSAPRYHARDVAKKLAELRGAALVLGSATPSLESILRAQKHEFAHAIMTERPGIALLPKVEIVDMVNAFAAGNRSVFSKALSNAIHDNYEAGNKTVLLLNRRGFANFLMCRECGCVPECPHCSESLTYHERTHSLDCHSCGRSYALGTPTGAQRCPNCGSPYMAAYGVGTQRIEDELKILLGEDAPIIRMDADTTKHKGAHQKLLEEFDRQKGAILLGTQMIAKGLDFPEVTLVGVINADTMLKMPDFRAAERTNALLEQVSGRAGRGEMPGQVFIQSYWASHLAISSIRRHERSSFVQVELAIRKEAHYPPYCRLSNIVLTGPNERRIMQLSSDLRKTLDKSLGGRPGFEILGPAPCLKSKIKDRYRRHILIKSPLGLQLGEELLSLCEGLKHEKSVHIGIDIDAYDMF